MDYKDYASIPIANNIATANFLICSTLVNEQYSLLFVFFFFFVVVSVIVLQ